VLSVLVVAASAVWSSTPAHAWQPNPLGGMNFWVNPNSASAQVAAAYQAAGDTTDAGLMRKLSTHASSTWLTNSSDATVAQVSTVMTSARQAWQVPVFVAYNIPHRDCGLYSAGGANTASEYATWIRRVAVAMNTGFPAVVVLEPDAAALTAAGCFSSSAASVESMLADAIKVLRGDNAVRVYVDAGNSAWLPDPTNLITVLRAAGASHATGISVNVSNFQWVSATVPWAQQITAALGNNHVVVDTSRNGLGPLLSNSGYTGPSWCNPPGRALGATPTSSTGVTGVDAYLWIKTPGSSDGDCGLGDPAAGTFWPDYALGLAARAAW